MEMIKVVDALSALAHQSRLAIFRLLVQAGPEGLPAGVISDKLRVAPATLSFHLANLAHAGLAHGRQKGRFVIYSANFENMRALVNYLTRNCCAGPTCSSPERPQSRQAPRRRITEEA